jgi:hypothetical protein
VASWLHGGGRKASFRPSWSRMSGAG